MKTALQSEAATVRYEECITLLLPRCVQVLPTCLVKTTCGAEALAARVTADGEFKKFELNPNLFKVLSPLW